MAAIEIDIARSGGRVTYDENPQPAEVGDQVFWTNHDTRAHWPGRAESASGPVTDPYFYMLNQIAPDSSSTAFVPDGSESTLYYACSLHPNDAADRGSITVAP